MKKTSALFAAAMFLATAACSSGNRSGGGSPAPSGNRFQLPNGYTLSYDMRTIDNLGGEEFTDEGLTFDCYIERAATKTAGSYCGFQVESTESGFSFDTIETEVPTGFGPRVYKASGSGNANGADFTFSEAYPDFALDFTYEFTITHVAEL